MFLFMQSQNAFYVQIHCIIMNEKNKYILYIYICVYKYTVYHIIIINKYMNIKSFHLESFIHRLVVN